MHTASVTVSIILLKAAKIIMAKGWDGSSLTDAIVESVNLYYRTNRVKHEEWIISQIIDNKLRLYMNKHTYYYQWNKNYSVSQKRVLDLLINAALT